MNRKQSIALTVAAANLLLVLLFPPVDEYSIATSKLPVFSGFHWILALPAKSVTNTSVLWLAISVILVNAGIAWLLLRNRLGAPSGRMLRAQNAVLVFTGVNLLLVVLFPPFESVFSLTKAILPSFEGFYFIFDQKPNHVIVTTMLYIETFLILLNGAIFWLLFHDRSSGGELTPAQLQELASRLHGKDGR